MKKLITLTILILGFTNLHSEDFNINGKCSVYFSPKGGVTQALVQYIDSSKVSIRLLAYNFTSQALGQALVRASQRGVDVQLVLDKSVPHEKNSILLMMLQAHIVTFIDHKHQIAHNKIIIVDNQWIETGSFNYTDNAENNNGENALICYSPEGAKIYNDNWELHKSHSQLEGPDDD